MKKETEFVIANHKTYGIIAVVVDHNCKKHLYTKIKFNKLFKKCHACGRLEWAADTVANEDGKSFCLDCCEVCDLCGALILPSENPKFNNRMEMVCRNCGD